MLDLVLVGGGLANGLIAWRLLMTRPDVSFALLEAGPTLGGNHTWGFRGTDVTKEQLEWLWILCSKSWPSHDVAFNEQPRRLGGGYHALTSRDFHWKLTERLKDRVRLKTKVTELTATEVTLGSGEVIEAKAVIDGRGLAAPAWPCGFRKSLGLQVELTESHGLEVPLLMDGRREEGALRFVQLLPWDERRLLLEVVSYANDAGFDVPALRSHLEAYLAARNLRIARVLGEESAALPIPLEGSLPAVAWPTVGVAAGLFHATTAHSLPMAVALADALPRLRELSAPALTEWLHGYAREHWEAQAFYRLLNRMILQDGARIFRSIYRHSDSVLARFNAGQLTTVDKLRLLARGGPPAWKAALRRSSRDTAA